MNVKTKERVFFLIRIIGGLILLVTLTSGNINSILKALICVTVVAIVLGITLGCFKETR